MLASQLATSLGSSTVPLLTPRPSGPDENQRRYDSGHTRKHVLQAIITPDGQIIGLWGAVEGE